MERLIKLALLDSNTSISIEALINTRLTQTFTQKPLRLIKSANIEMPY
jgi:hypothetical protein